MTSAVTGIASFLTGREAEGSTFSGIRLSLPLMTWLSVARERRQLGRLGAHQLRDIGIDAEHAAGEAARPFWDLPEGR